MNPIKNDPHTIIAREGWAILVIAIALLLTATVMEAIGDKVSATETILAQL